MERPKIDGFFIIMLIVSVALAAVVIITFKGIFSAVITAYETEQIQTSDSRVNKDKLEEAYKKTFEKGYTRLNIGG